MRRPRPKRRRVSTPADDLAAASLRYVNPALLPGIRRQRRGKGFSYTGPDGKPVKDRATLRRIRSLVIPPAWTDVWISPTPATAPAFSRGVCRGSGLTDAPIAGSGARSIIPYGRKGKPGTGGPLTA